jgi:hypothetical protein
MKPPPIFWSRGAPQSRAPAAPQPAAVKPTAIAPPPTRFATAVQAKMPSPTARGASVPPPAVRFGPAPPTIMARPPVAAARTLQRATIQRSSAATTYTLSVVELGNGVEKYGQFYWRQAFDISPKADGYVVQHIKRQLQTWLVWGTTNTPMSVADAEKCSPELRLSGWEEYWEYFEVKNGKTTAADQFTCSQIVPTTKHTSAGQYTITGEAWFTKTKPSGFTTGSTSNAANGLDYALKDPCTPAESNIVTRSACVTWYKSGAKALVLVVDGKAMAKSSVGDFDGAPIKP